MLAPGLGPLCGPRSGAAWRVPFRGRRPLPNSALPFDVDWKMLAKRPLSRSQEQAQTITQH